MIETRYGNKSSVLFVSTVFVILLLLWLAHLRIRYVQHVDCMSSIRCATGTIGEMPPSTLTPRTYYDRYYLATDQSSFEQCIAAITKCYHHPPSYFLILNGLMRCSGATGVVAGTALSAFFALGALVIFYLMLRLFASPYFSAIGTFCFGLSTEVFTQSLRVRHYTLTLFVNAIVLYMAIRIVSKKSKASCGTKWEWIVFALTQSLSMWTQYISVFELSLINLWLICRCARDGKLFWKPYIISLLTSVLLFTPWIPHLSLQMKVAEQQTTGYEALTHDALGSPVWACVSRFTQAFFRISDRFPLILGVMACVIIAVCIVFGRRQRTGKLALFGYFAVALAIVYFGLIVVGISPNYFGDLRFTLALVMNLWIVLLVGTSQLPHRVRVVILAFFLLGSSATEAIRYFRDATRPNAKTASLIASEGRHADLLLLDDPNSAFARVYPASGESDVLVLSQSELASWIQNDMEEWMVSKGKSPDALRVLYAPNLSRAFARQNSQEGMQTVVDRLTHAGMELLRYSNPIDTPNEDTSYAFLFVQRRNNAIETHGTTDANNRSKYRKTK